MACRKTLLSEQYRSKERLSIWAHSFTLYIAMFKCDFSFHLTNSHVLLITRISYCTDYRSFILSFIKTKFGTLLSFISEQRMCRCPRRLTPPPPGLFVVRSCITVFKGFTVGSCLMQISISVLLIIVISVSEVWIFLLINATT